MNLLVFVFSNIKINVCLAVTQFHVYILLYFEVRCKVTGLIITEFEV